MHVLHSESFLILGIGVILMQILSELRAASFIFIMIA